MRSCRLPKSTLAEVSEPVEAVPSQPISVPKKGVERAGAGEGEAEGGVEPAVAGDVTDGKHGGDGDDGEAEIDEGFEERASLGVAGPSPMSRPARMAATTRCRCRWR